jgi:hypothetical protein
MKLAILIQFVIVFSTYGQEKSFEQVALDYYTQTIHPNECSKKEKYILKDSIQTRKSIFLFGVCFEDYKKVEKVETFSVDSQNQDVRLKSSVFHILRFGKRTTKSIIFVNQVNSSPKKTVFVEITVRNNRIGKHYYMELTPQKEPLRWCKTEVIF